MSDTCRSCDAPIRWARTEANDRPIPLDAEPNTKGNVILVGEDGDKARVIGDLERLLMHENGEPLYLSHFATCPSAGAHRARRTA